MRMLKNSFWVFCCMVLFASFTFAQQITDEQFKKADSEYQRLTKEINRLHNEMSKASESKELDRYNELSKQYEKVIADRKKYEIIRKDYYSQNKELVGIQKTYNEGQQALKLGNMQEASAKYNEAIASGKKLNSPALSEVIAKSYYSLGYIHRKNKKLQDALDAYNNALKYSPSFDDGYYAIGNTYKDMGQYDTAIRNYEKAIDINPGFYQAYYNMGTVFVSQANKLPQGRKSEEVALLKKAEAAFRDAVRIKQDYDDALASLGRVLVESKRETEGIIYLSKAIEMDKRNSVAYYFLAVAYNNLNDPRSAIENADLCLKYRRNFGGALIEKGDAYMKLGSETKALSQYESALSDRQYRKTAEYKIDLIKNKDKYVQ